MSAFQGMDPVRLRGHGERCREGGRRIEELFGNLAAALAAASWAGPDGEAFRAAWAALRSAHVQVAVARLATWAEDVEAQAAEQDQASAVRASGAALTASPAVPVSPASPLDSPAQGALIGQALGEAPVPLPTGAPQVGADLRAQVAGTASAAIGEGFEQVMDRAIVLGEAGGLDVDGLRRFERDADDWGGTLEGWASGQEDPTVAEVLAGGLVVGGSGAGALLDLPPGPDSCFFDDRPGGIVLRDEVVHTVAARSAPEDLAGLIEGNDALRAHGSAASGVIGVQKVQGPDSTPRYIVQIPPTEGAGLLSMPAYGEQGNSRDWASNLRLVAGQDVAAMDDVRAALAEADVPAGAQVMMVGHSQGGIIGSHLAADPTFNSASGAPGTYDVTEAFSVGSPVQTVVPAHASTRVLNVHHGPLDPGLMSSSGDPVPLTDLEGLRVDGSHLSSPAMQEVELPGHTAPTLALAPAGSPWLKGNHDSVVDGHPELGYAASLRKAQTTNPQLLAFRTGLESRYLGPGVAVTESWEVPMTRGQG